MINEWLKYKIFEIWVWVGNKLGWNEVTIHASKNHTKVIGVTFWRKND